METTTACAKEETELPLKEPEKKETKSTEKKIWVAIEDSEESFYALQWALQYLFLGDDEPAMITVVHVQSHFQPAFIYPAGPMVYATPTVIEAMRKAQEESATRIFSRAMKLCQQHKVKAETILMKGEAKEMLVEAVEEMHVDLLVVGSRGLGQIKRTLLGSVSDYCAHHAKCPVLIVRPPKPSHN